MFAALSSPLADCVPARWDSAAPATLRLVKGTPINCLLLDPPYWSAEFIKEARAAGIRVLPVVRFEAEAARAAALDCDGLVAEGAVRLPKTALPVIRLANRGELTFSAPVEGTAQGLWPGIRVEKDGASAAAPTGAPWIETNGGFLRFARTVSAPGAEFWIAMRPPEDQALSGRNYVQALADAAMHGATWVLALDPGFREGLFAGREQYLKEWEQMAAEWRFLVKVREFGRWRDHGSLTLIQDSESGALFSGGFADMLAARHIPATITPGARAAGITKETSQVLLNIEPVAEGSERRKLLLDLARRGITIMNSPLDWNPGKPAGGSFTFPEDEIKELSDAWREINSMLGRRNFGLRVFGAPGALSNLKISPDGKKVAIHLLNYTGYPLQNISLHLAGRYSKARMITAAGETNPAVYPIEEGIEIEVDRLDGVAVIVVE